MRLAPLLPGRREASSPPDDEQMLLHPHSYWIHGTFIALWLLLYEYCSYANQRDPTSYFFNQAKGYDRQLSLQYEGLAHDYIVKHNTTGKTFESSTPPLLCLGVATIARPSGPQYVRNTIGSLLQGLSEDDRSEVHLTTFIAHTNASQHPIYHEPWLKAVSNQVLEYDHGNNEDMMMLRLFESDHHPRNKSMYDYGYLLQNCYNTGAPFVAVVEDDTIAKPEWYKHAFSAAHGTLKRHGNSDWLYLRLFYTEGLLGWNSEEWVRYLTWSIACFCILSGSLVALRTRSPRLQRHLANTTIAIVCCVYLPVYIGLYFMAGRISMQPPSPGIHEMPRFGCCSQGFIYPRSIVPRVIARMKQAMHEDYYVDMLLERWADEENLKRYAIFPSLLQHVGGHSSKGWGYDEHAGTTWNFAFEREP